MEFDLFRKEVEFADQFHEFILELLHQAKHYLPLKDDYMDLFKVLKPEDFDRVCWLDLVDKFPTLIEEGEFSTFGEDLDKLEAYNFQSWIQVYWVPIIINEKKWEKS